MRYAFKRLCMQGLVVAVMPNGPVIPGNEGSAEHLYCCWADSSFVGMTGLPNTSFLRQRDSTLQLYLIIQKNATTGSSFL